MNRAGKIWGTTKADVSGHEAHEAVRSVLIAELAGMPNEGPLIVGVKACVEGAENYFASPAKLCRNKAQAMEIAPHMIARLFSEYSPVTFPCKIWAFTEEPTPELAAQA